VPIIHPVRNAGIENAFDRVGDDGGVGQAAADSLAFRVE